MARKRAKRRVVYRYIRPRRRARRSGIERDIIGMAGYTIAEGFIDNLLAQTGLNVPADLVEAAIGYYLKGRKGVLGAVGKVMFYINAYQLVKQMLGNINLGNIFSGIKPIQQQQNSGDVWS